MSDRLRALLLNSHFLVISLRMSVLHGFKSPNSIIELLKKRKKKRNVMSNRYKSELNYNCYWPHHIYMDHQWLVNQQSFIFYLYIYIYIYFFFYYLELTVTFSSVVRVMIVGNKMQLIVTPLGQRRTENFLLVPKTHV